MKLKAAHIVQYVIFFGLAVFLLWYTSKKISFHELYQSILNAPGFILLAIILIGFLSHYFRAARWSLLIETIDKKPSLINTMFAVMIGYIVNLATPRLGEVARCGILSKYEKIPVEKLAGTMLAERLIDVITLALVALLTFAIEFNTVKSYMAEKLAQIKDKLPGNSILIIVSLILLVVVIIAYWMYRKLQNNDSKLSKIYKNVVEGISSVFRLKKITLFLLHTLMIWICYWAMVYVGFNALKDTEFLGAGAALSILSLGSLGIIATPGGAGAYQLIVINILESLYHINTKGATIFANLSWAVQTVVLVVGGIASFILFPIYNRKRNQES